ncbi:endo-1,4-beta-xylanase [Mucilaginibacter sp. KACC 22773]|uniref:endo-1,4-beta-xylanase n=1 Tax=Mucilaginibacter sp. KACC 22773 TaxID=3025671 RepID=UPI0023673D23|nr:endo-1,4-beta-xylanase [Mucilaginibacter sp. KACC 22773]WDF79166.1 endo-1,4-beta-xylanase [Mucilaginibacter sp. KACC 22773]
MQINKYRSHIFISLLTFLLLCLFINFYLKEREVQQYNTVGPSDVRPTDNDANSKDDKQVVNIPEKRAPAEHKHNGNAIASLSKKEEVQDNSDPGALKRLLLKKGIYFGDFLGNEDVKVAAPRPSNFLTQVNQYFNLYTVPAWFHHVEFKNGQYDYRGPDEVADFAIAHGAKIQMQSPVWWHVPDWVKNGNFSPDELKNILKNHIQAIMRHYKAKYPGAVISWGIVNESMSDSPDLNPKYSLPNGLRSNIPIWNVIHKPGSNDPTDYIQLAFEWAHEADPTAKLYWTEFNVEYKGYKMDRWFSIVKQLKAKGVPIDGVGFQTHLYLGYNHPFSELTENMDRFASIGLTSEITELDVIMSSTSPIDPPLYRPTPMATPSKADFDKQGNLFAGVISACVKAKKCDAIILWGEWDPGSSANTQYKNKLTGSSLGNMYPNIFDQNMKPKPAVAAMVNAAQ